MYWYFLYFLFDLNYLFYLNTRFNFFTFVDSWLDVFIASHGIDFVIKDSTHLLGDEFCNHFSMMAKQKSSSMQHVVKCYLYQVTFGPPTFTESPPMIAAILFVPGLANRAGKRYITDPSDKKSGGACVRGTTKISYIVICVCCMMMWTGAVEEKNSTTLVGKKDTKKITHTFLLHFSLWRIKISKMKRFTGVLHFYYQVLRTWLAKDVNTI